LKELIEVGVELERGAVHETRDVQYPVAAADVPMTWTPSTRVGGAARSDLRD